MFSNVFLPGNSAGDSFGMVRWPLQWLRVTSNLGIERLAWIIWWGSSVHGWCPLIWASICFKVCTNSRNDHDLPYIRSCLGIPKGKLTLTSPVHESLRFAFAFFTAGLFRRCTGGKFLGWVWMVLVNDERFRWRMMRMLILKKEFPFDFYWSPYSWDTTCEMMTHNDSKLILSMLTQRLRDKQEITRQMGYDFDGLMDIQGWCSLSNGRSI